MDVHFVSPQPCICSSRFLYEVQRNSKVNKMSVENLATVMGVNLFKPQVEDAFSMMKGQLSCYVR